MPNGAKSRGGAGRKAGGAQTLAAAMQRGIGNISATEMVRGQQELNRMPLAQLRRYQDILAGERVRNFARYTAAKARGLSTREIERDADVIAVQGQAFTQAVMRFTR
jgi:hypothetical protein